MCSIIGILNNVEGIVYSVIRLLPADAIPEPVMTTLSSRKYAALHNLNNTKARI